MLRRSATSFICAKIHKAFPQTERENKLFAFMSCFFCCLFVLLFFFFFEKGDNPRMRLKILGFKRLTFKYRGSDGYNRWSMLMENDDVSFHLLN